MEWNALITLLVIALALVLFITEAISVDLVALLATVLLTLAGVISAQESVGGFSNHATLTVAFMFILSGALLKTGALQYLAHWLAPVFRYNFKVGIILMMCMIAFVSAFVNNTPVVAVFIPVVIQIAHASGQSPAKMLIPLSYASIFGGTCTLIGTSTNILVSGIAEKNGLEGFTMFSLAPVGLCFLAVGITYMMLIGVGLLPKESDQTDLKQKFGMWDYLTEIELLEKSDWIGQKIMDAPLVRELDMDIIEVRRSKNIYTLPAGDFLLLKGDVLKVRCNVDKIKALKDRLKIAPHSSLKIGGENLQSEKSTLVELIITANSELENKTLREGDFRRKYRAIPLAIKHREEVKHEQLYETKLKAGDVILAEIKTHYVRELKKMEVEQEAAFVLLSEDTLVDFNGKNFAIVMTAMASVIIAATFNLLPILVATMAAVVALVLLKCITMNEAYEAINWKIIFLLAGALSMGTALQNSQLDQQIASLLIDNLGLMGKIAIISGLYLLTSLLTEIMSNNATAALLAPIAIATAQKMGLDPMPFLVAITLASSASFMTPVGYQTNAMVYSAGNYRFKDFLRVGSGLNFLFWIIASVFIPIFYEF